MARYHIPAQLRKSYLSNLRRQYYSLRTTWCPWYSSFPHFTREGTRLFFTNYPDVRYELAGVSIEEILQALHGFLLHIGQHVRVSVEGDGNRRVPNISCTIYGWILWETKAMSPSASPEQIVGNEIR